MADINFKLNDVASKYRQRTGALLKAVEDLVSIDAEYVALGGVGSLPDATTFPDITITQFATYVATAQGLLTYLEGVGIKTNLYSLSDGSHHP